METGIVKDIDGNELIVSMQRSEACKKCGACTAGLQSKEMILHAENKCNASIGDEVAIQLEPVNFIKAVLIMYGIPLIALLVGIGIGSAVIDESVTQYYEVLVLGCGLVLLAVSYLIIHINEKRFKEKKYKPSAVKIVEK